MRIATVICCVLALAGLTVAGMSYLRETPSKVSVRCTDDGIILQNVGDTRCVVVVNAVEGDYQFKLAVRETITLVTASNISCGPGMSLVAFGWPVVHLDLVHWLKPVEGWPGTVD
jgi:hypothetical protein